jgi:hypothetical protein
MAQYIEKIHTFIQSLAKKERGVFIDPEQIDDALNFGVMNIFRKEYRHYEVTQEVSDKLSVFKKQVSLTPDVDGKVSIPSDYFHVTDIGFQPATSSDPETEIKMVDDAKWRFRLNRKTAAPSLKTPVGRYLSASIEVRPKTLPNVKITYLKAPTKLVWGYTLSGSRPVYANTGGINGDSVDPELREIDHIELIMCACSFLALTISDADLLQYSEAKKVSE